MKVLLQKERGLPNISYGKTKHWYNRGEFFPIKDIASLFKFSSEKPAERKKSAINWGQQNARTYTVRAIVYVSAGMTGENSSPYIM